jgi:hypothetical protein
MRGSPVYGSLEMSDRTAIDRETIWPFLLLCIGTKGVESKASVLAGWTEVQWNGLLREAEICGIPAYCYSRLREDLPDMRIPDGVDRRFRNHILRNASGNLRLFHDLEATIRTLRDEGIPVILLKGAYLATSVYRNTALRTMSDVDILVREDDLHGAVTRLFKAGFRPVHAGPAAYIEWSARNRFHVIPNAKHFFDLVHPSWRVKLDVHTALAEDEKPFSIDMDGLWARATRVMNAELGALVLSPTDSLLYQCMHTSYHHQFLFGLQPFCDVLEIVRRYRDELQWETVPSRASQWKVGRGVYATLSLSRETLGVPIPENVLDALRPEDGGAEALNIARRRMKPENHPGRSLPAGLVRYWKSRRLPDLAAAVRQAVLLPQRRIAVKYNVRPGAARILLLYPVRLWDLFRRWGRITWRILAHDPLLERDAELNDQDAELERWLTSTEPHPKTGTSGR